jgi:A/G-specific adenine glycosylase
VLTDSQDHYVFEKRTDKGIWQNLYQFPLLESMTAIKSEKTLLAHPDFPKKFNPIDNSIKLWNPLPIIHRLSHQSLEVNFWKIKSKKKLTNSIPEESLKKFAVPVVIHNFIKKFF